MNQAQRKNLRAIGNQVNSNTVNLMNIVEMLTEGDAATLATLNVAAIKEEFLDTIIATLECLRDEVETEREDEEGKYDNMSENFQNGEAGEKLQASMEALEAAVDYLQSAIDELSTDTVDAAELAETIQSAIDDDLESAQGSIDEATQN